MKAFTPILAAISSAFLLFLSFPSWDQSYLLAIAFIPLLFATEGMTPKRAYLWAALSGWLAVSIGFYWVGEWGNYVLNIPRPWHHLISIGHGFIVCHLFGLQFYILRWWEEQKRASPLFLFPLITASLFSFYPMIFPWSLGDGLVPLSFFIQPIDFTGVYGLDFIIALINYLLYLIIKHPKTIRQERPVHFGIFIVILWLVYGISSQANWKSEVASWERKKIGIIQTNRPASLSTPQPEPGYSRIYPYEFDISKNLIQQGAKVVIWPEGKFFGYSFWPQVKEAFHRFTDQHKTPLIFHDTYLEKILGQKLFYNSSLHLQPGQAHAEIYHKMQLVPFGEYTPIIGDSPFFKRILGQFLSSLTAGKENRVFQAGQMNFVPKLCYESQFPMEVAKSIGFNAQGKVLLFQSQDGWYGISNQPDQHLASSILRAVENRVPMIHVINNGASAIAGPDGSIQYISKKYQEDNAIGLLPFNSEKGGSFYSENPYLFIGAMRFIFVVFLAVAFRDALIGKRKKNPEDDRDWE